MAKKSPANKTRASASPWHGTGPVIETAPLPIVEVQGAEHLVTFVNTAFCGLLGKARADLLGQPFAEIVPGGEKCVTVLDHVYASGQAATHVYDDHSSSNPAYWMYAMWPRLDARKQAAGVIIHMTTSLEFRDTGVAINEALLIAGLRQHELTAEAEKLNVQLGKEIAERKGVEIALRAAVEELKRARGIAEAAKAAKDNFLATLSHELRTPLTPVLMAASALKEDVRLSPEVREQLGMIERNVALEARLIDDLLDLTKIAHGKLLFRPELCDAHQLINHAVEIVREDARGNSIEIERNFTAHHSRLIADPVRFQQIIWNLLRNAVKFTPRGGKVAVRTLNGKNSAGETGLTIEISDSGIGIEDAHLEQIFLPFDQGGLPGEHQFGGVGLGLSIARAVVDLHGGRIFARSAGLKLGSTFVIELPIADESLTPRGQNSVSQNGSPPPTNGAKSTRRRLLLVEDHIHTLRAISGLLRRDGHFVVTASTIAEGLLAAAKNQFDFVISDLGLPDGEGTELMKQLHDAYGLEGIALSGFGAREDIIRSRAAGFIQHMIKPVTIVELRRAIDSFPVSPIARAPTLASRTGS